MKGTAITRSVGRIIRGSATIGARSLRIVVSSGELARDGLALDQRRWILPRSGKAPLLNAHGDTAGAGIRCILGDVSDFEVRTIELDSGRTGPALLGTANFAEAEISEDAEVALQLYRAGYADSFSVSFLPHWDGSTDRTTPSSQELLECSCVAVGADPNSKVLARAIRRRLQGRRETAEDRAARARALLARYPAQRTETAADRYQRALKIRAQSEAQELAETEAYWDARSGRRGIG